MKPANYSLQLKNKSLDKREITGLVIVLAIAAAIRLYQLGSASLWVDEALTIKLSALPWSTLWITAYDPTPPLYYSVIRLMLNIGDSEWLLRLPSAVFGILTVLVMYLATRMVSGVKAAFVAALVISLSLVHIEYSQEARAYALLGLCISLSFLGLVCLYSRWRTTPSGLSPLAFLRAGGGLYALGLLAALYTHNISVFYWMGVQFFFLAWWFRPFRWSASCFLCWASINLLVLLLWLPWLFASFEVMEGGSFSWLQHYDFQLAFKSWRNIHGFGLGQPFQPYLDIGLIALGLVGIYGLKNRTSILVLLLALLVFSSVIIWAYGLIATPVLMTRTLMWGLLFSAVLIGIGVSRLPYVVVYPVLAALLVFGLIGIRNYFDIETAENEDWRSAAGLFNSKQQPGDIILLRASYIDIPFLYYVNGDSSDWEVLGWNCHRQSARTGRIVREKWLARVKWAKEERTRGKPLSRKPGNNLWIIESHCNPRSWPEANGWLEVNWGVLETHRFNQISVYRLAPR